MSSAKPTQISPTPVSGQFSTLNDRQSAQVTTQDGFAPSPEFIPSAEPQPEFQYHACLHLDTAASKAHSSVASASPHTPASAGLRIQTDHVTEKQRQDAAAFGSKVPIPEVPPDPTVFNAGLPVRSSSIRSVHSSRVHRPDSISPGSTVSSPAVGPLVEMTPLPSPISLLGSPRGWRNSIDSESNDPALDTIMDDEVVKSNQEPINFARASPKKSRVPLVPMPASGQETQIYNASAAAHARQRSLSEYVPDGMQIPRSRNVVVSTSGGPPAWQPFSAPDEHMHREQYLAVQRGLAIPKPPTPPDSNRGTDSGDLESPLASPRMSKGPLPLLYEARTVRSGKWKRWRGIRQLGKGTFSTVMLATSEGVNDGLSLTHANLQKHDSYAEDQVDPKSLVAVKVCEQGPAGGADEKKIETSIKRELDIMKSINHPSLVQLRAVNMCERQAFLVLNYCAGGDLFELASLKLDFLTPPLIRRIFSELVAAVQYLHKQYIVHRDIKLENVLVNLSAFTLPTISDWQSYPFPVVTLTDLGLGRWIPKPPESPLLDTRCGSEDYAAPEVLIGQEYDGRVTDAWALGVLLYALMEGRLPFDPIPGSRRKSPTSHRIARCEWQWVRWADANGEWDSVKGKELDGARAIVEDLLARARSRWSLEMVQGTEWVSGGIQVDGGLRRADDEDD